MFRAQPTEHVYKKGGKVSKLSEVLLFTITLASVLDCLHLPLTMAETGAQRVNESMSVEDVVAFLSSHGIPGHFCEAFEGNAKVREKRVSE